jgi:hypothetical protein
MNPSVPPIHFLNIGYFFDLLYNLLIAIKTHSFAIGGGNWITIANDLWIFVTLLAYLFCIACIGVLVYYSTRLYQIAEEEKSKYTTISKESLDAKLDNSRWNYISQLIESPQQSDWRSAIIEADIMLDELLTKLGYLGDSVGDKLKTANASHFHTLEDAWEAHKVRNEIAHRGSSYELSPNVAYRAIGRYENVLREFNEI